MAQPTLGLVLLQQLLIKNDPQMRPWATLWPMSMSVGHFLDCHLPFLYRAGRPALVMLLTGVYALRYQLAAITIPQWPLLPFLPPGYYSGILK